MYWRFDSILVRLKVKNTSRPSTLPPMFRFHTGSIKSLPNAGVTHDTDAFLSFDSILVRLKDTCSTAYTAFEKSVSIPYWFD